MNAELVKVALHVCGDCNHMQAAALLRALRDAGQLPKGFECRELIESMEIVEMTAALLIGAKSSERRMEIADTLHTLLYGRQTTLQTEPQTNKPEDIIV